MLLKCVAVLLLTRGVAQTLAMDEMRRHVEYLASPELEGRYALRKGSELAASYIADQLASYGLKPGETRSFISESPVTVGYRPSRYCSIEFSGASKRVLRVGTDFNPVVGSAGKLVSGTVLYAGFGLARDGWNDYRGHSAAGKIVVVLGGVPNGQDQETNAQKAQTATQLGAVGILFVSREGGELPGFNRGEGIGTETDIAAASLHGSLFRWLTGLDLGAAEAANGPRSLDLPVHASLHAQLEPFKGIGKNVIGVLPGTDSNAQSIIVGAHYDHIGYGELASRTGSSAIHPGADDNASGTAAVLALARHFALSRSNRRTLIFAFFTAEEEGLLGSDAWARSHPELLKNASAMLNLDMVGRLRDNKLFVYGTSSAVQWDGLLASVQTTLKVVPAPNVRGDSDQASFARRNVPVLSMSTGLHDEYHTERDTVETLNMQGLATVAQFVAGLLAELDRGPRLAFSPDVIIGTAAGQGAFVEIGRPVRVGFIPSKVRAEGGVLLLGTTVGTPAGRAGFKAGDILISFNGRRVNDLASLLGAYRTAEPGERVNVVYLRGKDRLSREVLVERAAP